jgi:hypothetical protein
MIGLLVAGYVLCLFTMYSLVPTVYRMASATFVNMNLITNNFYSLLIGLFFLNAKVRKEKKKGEGTRSDDLYVIDASILFGGIYISHNRCYILQFSAFNNR